MKLKRRVALAMLAVVPTGRVAKLPLALAASTWAV